MTKMKKRKLKRIYATPRHKRIIFKANKSTKCYKCQRDCFAGEGVYNPYGGADWHKQYNLCRDCGINELRIKICKTRNMILPYKRALIKLQSDALKRNNAVAKLMSGSGVQTERGGGGVI